MVRLFLQIKVDGVVKVQQEIKGVSSNMGANIEKALRESAMFIERKSKDAITRHIPPPLKPATIKRKGSSTPLIDTGLMRSQLTADYGHLKSSNMVQVGVFGNRSMIAVYHELGTKHIPQRSFLKSTVDDPLTEREIFGMFLKAVEDSING